MKYLLAVVLNLGLLAAPLTASATGGVWCYAKDANMTFDFKAVSSRDGTGGWFNIEGRLETLFGNLPPALASFDIKDENLTQRWWDGHEVRLEIQKYQDEPYGRVRLTLVTKSPGEELYRGDYVLDIDMNGVYSEKKGSMTCDSD